MTSDIPAIELDNLRVGYKNNSPLLTGFYLTVQPGDCVGIQGLSGCGKSTLLHCICGLIPRSIDAEMSGSVRLFGRPVEDYPRQELVQTIGVVFQDPETQLFCDSVEDEIAFGLENICLPPAEMSSRVEESLALFGLEKYRLTSPKHLSGGEKQLVALAAVLALRPRILLFDESFSQLDEAGKARLLACIASLRDSGMTIVMADHDPENLQIAQTRLHMGAADAADAMDAADTMDAADVPDTPDAPATPDAHDAPVAPDTSDALDTAGEPGPTPVEIIGDGTRQMQDREQSPPAAIRLRELRFVYPGNESFMLDIPDLSLSAGVCTAVGGNNGSGKTTLGKLIAGLLRPSKGSVLLNGEDIAGWPPAKIGAGVGYLFQEPSRQLFAPTVLEDLSFPLVLKGMDKEEALALAQAMLDRFAMGSMAEAVTYTLSRGEKQRLAIASLMINTPEFLVLDEPTTGLDARCKGILGDMLRQLPALGVGVLLISHDRSFVRSHADFLYRMEEGRVRTQ